MLAVEVDNGIRCVASKKGADVRIWSRHGREMTAQFPEVAAAIGAGVTAAQAVLAGELVVVASDGRPDFYVVMDRHSQGNAERMRRAARTHPATLMLFGVLEIDGKRITGHPLSAPQAAPATVVCPRTSPSLVESWPGTAGTAAGKAVAARDQEGLVGKRLDSRYQVDTHPPAPCSRPLITPSTA